jgi:hypothetical protein
VTKLLAVAMGGWCSDGAVQPPTEGAVLIALKCKDFRYVKADDKTAIRPAELQYPVRDSESSIGSPCLGVCTHCDPIARQLESPALPKAATEIPLRFA